MRKSKLIDGIYYDVNGTLVPEAKMVNNNSEITKLLSKVNYIILWSPEAYNATLIIDTAGEYNNNTSPKKIGKEIFGVDDYYGSEANRDYMSNHIWKTISNKVDTFAKLKDIKSIDDFKNNKYIVIGDYFIDDIVETADKHNLYLDYDEYDGYYIEELNNVIHSIYYIDAIKILSKKLTVNNKNFQKFEVKLTPIK